MKTEKNWPAMWKEKQKKIAAKAKEKGGGAHHHDS